ncbi:hypothetical protein [Algoriphagus aquimarinus]|uniref:Uncharacterized protein n=1 Tax=Algoriphagus aquimarinus TaxID=237018 RepID=A0A1I0YRS1_9BACT|nr:hypothetical protein [Algoriphagus aquimarinus]SFB16014.1 hypothetical protein SAMN04489723_10518 [Algoriphagus aquimarinus]
MRKLTEQELLWIHSRQKSLHIRYTEVYEEIFDHYCTTLENSTEIDSPSIIAKLNDTFSWSVVKGMDKELEKNVSKQIWVAQLDFLKFWNRGFKGLLASIIGFALLAIAIFIIPASELILVFLVIILITTAGVFFMKRDALSFRLSHKTVSISSATIIKRVGILNTIFMWIYVIPSVLTRGEIHSNTLFVWATAIVTIFSVMYSISLLAIASDLPAQRTAI